MPELEETLKYRIQLDDTDLGSQLDQIRDRVNIGMAATAMDRGTLPRAVDLLAPTPTGFVTDPAAEFGGQVDANFWQKLTSGGPGGFLQSVAGQLDEAAQRTQLGYHRFTSDMRRLGLMTPTPAAPELLPMPGPGGGSLPEGLAQSLRAILSPQYGGFDVRGPITPHEYRQPAVANIGESVGDFVTGNMGAIAGTTIGAIGGPGGAFVGWGIGGLVDIGLSPIIAPAREREQLATGIRQLARANRVQISRGESRDIVREMQERTNTFSGIAGGESIEEYQENILGFAQAGGLTGARGFDDLRDRIRGVLDNTRQVQQDLNVFADEAVQIMGQIQQKMLGTSEGITGLTAQARFIGGATGMQPMEVLNLGLQGAQMVAGTGITGRAGMMMAWDARMQAERLAQATDPYTQQMVAGAGGANSVAQMLTESTIRWGLSGQGSMGLAAIMGGYTPGSGMRNLLNTAAGVFRDPTTLYTFPAVQPRLFEGMDPGERQVTLMGTVIDELDLLGVDITPESIQANLMRKGFTWQEAYHQKEAFLRSGERDVAGERMGKLFTEVQGRVEARTLGPLDRLRGVIGSFITESPFGGVAGLVESAGEEIVGFGRSVGRGIEKALSPGTVFFDPEGISQDVSTEMRLMNKEIVADLRTKYQQNPEELTAAIAAEDWKRFIKRNTRNEFRLRRGPYDTSGAGGATEGDIVTTGPLEGLSDEYIKAFKELSFNFDTDSQDRLVKKFQEWHTGGIDIKDARTWVNNLDKFNPAGVNTTSSEYINESKELVNEVLTTNFTGVNSIASGQKVARIVSKGRTNDINKLSPTERSYAGDAIQQSPTLTKKIYGGLRPNEYQSTDKEARAIEYGLEVSARDLEKQIETGVTRSLGMDSEGMANKIFEELPPTIREDLLGDMTGASEVSRELAAKRLIRSKIVLGREDVAKDIMEDIQKGVPYKEQREDILETEKKLEYRTTFFGTGLDEKIELETKKYLLEPQQSNIEKGEAIGQLIKAEPIISKVMQTYKEAGAGEGVVLDAASERALRGVVTARVFQGMELGESYNIEKPEDVKGLLGLAAEDVQKGLVTQKHMKYLQTKVGPSTLESKFGFKPEEIEEVKSPTVVDEKEAVKETYGLLSSVIDGEKTMNVSVKGSSLDYKNKVQSESGIGHNKVPQSSFGR